MLVCCYVIRCGRKVVHNSQKNKANPNSTLSDSISEASLGKGPEKLLLKASRMTRESRFEIPLGKWPEKLFLLISKLLKFLNLKIPTGSFSENELWLKFSSTRSEKTLNWFSDKTPPRFFTERSNPIIKEEFSLHFTPDQEHAWILSVEPEGKIQSFKLLELSRISVFKLKSPCVKGSTAKTGKTRIKERKIKKVVVMYKGRKSFIPIGTCISSSSSEE